MILVCSQDRAGIDRAEKRGPGPAYSMELTTTRTVVVNYLYAIRGNG